MGPFICLLWPVDALAGPAEPAEVGAFSQDLARLGSWRVQQSGEGWRLFTLAHRPIAVKPIDRLGSFVLGDVFAASGSALSAPAFTEAPGPTWVVARRLLETAWGRYVAVLRGAHGGLAVLRDPCGAPDTLVWTKGDATVIATDLPEPLMQRFSPGLGLDWRALHALLADPLFGRPRAPIRGMTTLPPGGLVEIKCGEICVEQVWRPQVFAQDPITDAKSAGTELRRRVELCVAAFAGQPGPILAEVSGGFDSSVVAATLVEVGADVAGWCHYYSDDPSGDERRFARALGQCLCIEVLERPRPRFRADPEMIGRSQFGPRPSAFALDGAYDADTIALADSLGARRLFTGFGGDGLFWLAPLTPIARDLVKRRGLGALVSDDFGALARWCRTSVWRLMRETLWRRGLSERTPSPRWVQPLGRESDDLRHPWLMDQDGLTPAKALHIQEQVLAQVSKGVSLRGQAIDLVHPLLSQPVLEHCLRIPVDVLSTGGRDRALARRAFEDRLPAIVRDRRSKGELGLYYSRAIAEGLPELRDFLLGGRLVSEGLLIPSELEAVLNEPYLAQHGGFSSVLNTVAVEAWVRRWEGPALRTALERTQSDSRFAVP